MRWCLAVLWAVCSLGCAAPTAQSSSTTPPITELVVEEADIIEARRPKGTQVGRTLVPELPGPLPSLSDDFRRGWDLALAALADPGPGAPPDLEADYQAWTGETFTPWLTARGQTFEELTAPLDLVASGPPHEHVVAAAVIGTLYTQLVRDFTGVTAPPAIRNDPELVRSYHHGLYEASGEWIETATRALYHCAKNASEQSEPPFRPWMNLCHEQLARLQDIQKEAESIKQAMEAAKTAEPAEPSIEPSSGPTTSE
jgi:hypothetical protein